MSRNFESLNGSMVPPQNAVAVEMLDNPTLNLNESVVQELAQFERSLADRFGKLRVLMQQGGDAAAAERAEAERTLTALRNEIGELRDSLREAEQLLHARNDEIKNLSTNVQVLTAKTLRMEQALEQSKADAASVVQRHAVTLDNANAKIIAIEAQLVAAQETIRAREATIQQIEGSLQTKLASLERQVRDKEQLLDDSQQQIAALEAEVARLKAGILEMASLMRQHAEVMTVAAQANREPSSTKEVPTLPLGHLKFAATTNYAER